MYDDLESSNYPPPDQIGVEYIKKYEFCEYSFPYNLKSYTDYFPTIGDYFAHSPSYYGIIEIDDLAKLGLRLSAGRMPENVNEAVITNYSFETYKQFGISAGTYINEEVTDFTDIYEEVLMGAVSDWGDRRLGIKIVGMIDFTLDEFDDILSVNKPEFFPDEVQEQQLKNLHTARGNYLNYLYMPTGSYANFEYHYAYSRLRDWTITMPDYNESYIAVTVTNRVMNGNFYEKSARNTNTYIPLYTYNDSDSKYMSKADGIAYAETFDGAEDTCVLISTPLIPKLLSAELLVEYEAIMAKMKGTSISDDDFEMREEWLEFLNQHIFGKTMDIGVNTKYGGVAFNRTVPTVITGVCYEVSSIYFAPAQSFYDKMYFEISNTVLIKADDIDVLLMALDNMVIPLGDNISLRYIINGDNPTAIYSLNNTFQLCIALFNTLSFVFGVFAIILIYGFINASIQSRKKDIGVLRSLGAKRMDIAWIFIVEGIIIAVLGIFVSIGLCYGGFVFLKWLISQNIGELATMYELVSFTWFQPLLMSAVTIFAVSVSVALPIISISSKQPIDAIKSGNE
jgi:ABC-type antimicrobial peptide transport system permease subunit